MRILDEADTCTEPGETGALLRREGLYSSILATWRRQRREGALAGLSPKKRGRKGDDEATREIKRLKRENAALRRRLEQAKTVIEVQKKLSDVLGITLPEAGRCIKKALALNESFVQAKALLQLLDDSDEPS